VTHELLRAWERRYGLPRPVELDDLLVTAHGMPLVEYEVLLKLSIAGGRMRMFELANAALLSRSGLTRIVEELEAL